LFEKSNTSKFFLRGNKNSSKSENFLFFILEKIQFEEVDSSGIFHRGAASSRKKKFHSEPNCSKYIPRGLSIRGVWFLEEKNFPRGKTLRGVWLLVESNSKSMIHRGFFLEELLPRRASLNHKKKIIVLHEVLVHSGRRLRPDLFRKSKNLLFKRFFHQKTSIENISNKKYNPGGLKPPMDPCDLWMALDTLWLLIKTFFCPFVFPFNFLHWKSH